MHRSSFSPITLLLVLAALVAAPPLSAAPQPPDAPAPWLHLSGEASGTLAPEDLGFFNDTSYEHNALRLLRVGLRAAVRPGGRLSLLAEVRSENGDEPRVYSLLVRARPRGGWPLDVQAGLIPPVFGAHSRDQYGQSTPFLATPIAYQYLTTLRADSVPAAASDLLRVRGGGWLVRHSLGAPTLQAGLPLVESQRYDAGVQARYRGDVLEAAVAVSRGPLCRPGWRDEDHGAQISSRVAWRPHPALILGASQARGEWLSSDVQDLLRPYGPAPARQTAWGADAEVSRGYWLARAEVVWSTWSGLPVGAGGLREPVEARAFTVESRWRAAAGLTAGLRGEHLGFSRLDGGTGTSQSWDAPVTRLEAGVAYSPVRHLIVKGGYQRNWRDGGRVRRSGLWVGQVTAWF
jgi:hypothetical protein